MLEKIKSLNSDQRKYLSGLAAIGCISWASPIFNFITKLHLHTTFFSVEYMCSLLYCLIMSMTFSMLGIIILERNKL